MFIQAKNFGPSRDTSEIRLIVIHVMEAPEKPRTARNIANWFAGRAAPMASVHYCVDNTETIQCVDEAAVAWGAPKANRSGIHIEHAGYTYQSLEGWDDEYSRATLLRSANLAVTLIDRYSIPLIKLSAEDLRDTSAMGFCGHVDVTYGRNGGRGHVDPGWGFPWGRYFDHIRRLMRATSPNA